MARLEPRPVEAKLRELNGNMAAVARHFGVARQAVAQFVQKRPKLRQVMLDCRESRIDVAESALDRAVLNGEGWAISLTLKTIGKDRGYVERTEVKHDGGTKLAIVEEIVDAVDGAGESAPDAGGLPQE